MLLPNDMITGVFGSSLSHNDVGILNVSMLNRYLEEVLFPNYVKPDGMLSALFGNATI
jgi:hypothetical protein